MAEEVKVTKNVESMEVGKDDQAKKEVLEGNKQEVRFNRATLVGTFEDEFKFSHQYGAKRFYKNTMAVKRLSGVIDHVSLVVPEKFIVENVKGTYAKVVGKFNSHRAWNDDEKIETKHFLAVKQLTFIYDENEDDIKNINVVCMRGRLCSRPNFRITGKGSNIVDFVLKMENVYETNGHVRRDYINCIAWNDSLETIRNVDVDDPIKVWGRIQSRTFYIQNPDVEGGKEYKTVNEVAVSKIETFK